MARIIGIILLLGAWGWGDDGAFPDWLDPRESTPPAIPLEERATPPLALVVPFGQRLTFRWNPFAGSGPFHFDNLSASPYYARMKDVELGIRLGFDLALSEQLHLGLQLPYVYNPAPPVQAAPGTLTLMNDLEHLDIAIGLAWSF